MGRRPPRGGQGGRGTARCRTGAVLLGGGTNAAVTCLCARRDSKPPTAGRLPVPPAGHPEAMRFGNVEIRPLGGGLGCLLMILFSVVASVLLTVIANLLLN
jgi:hypothetical protein